MTHHHDQQPHGHRHPPEAGGGLSLEAKLERLLAHWIDHNADHADTYRDWAAQAQARDLAEVAARLTKAADLTEAISEQFKGALKALP
jgi:hypothetical protein